MSDLAKPERLTRQGMSPSGKRWSFGLLAAVALHSAGGALLLVDDKAPVTEPETVITVQLAAQSASDSASAASTQASEQQQEPQPQTSSAAPAQQPQPQDVYEPSPLATKTAATPDPTPKTQSQPQPQVEPEPVNRPAPKTSIKTEEHAVPEPIKKPATQQVNPPGLFTESLPVSSQAAPTNKSANTTQSTATKAATSNSASSSAPSTMAQGSSTAPSTTASQAKTQTPASAKAAKKATQNYYAMISAHLNRHKSYSAAAKKQQLTGVVTVRFTVEPNGVISASSIKTSSGHTLLDDETLKLLARVSPLPPMPADMSQEPVSISLPINYQLQTR